MTRRTIAFEGVLSEIPNTWLGKGSLSVDYGAKLPVTSSFDFQHIVGWASDFQRNEETGEITIDVVLLPEYEFEMDKRDLDEDMYDYTFYATDVVSEQIAATEEQAEHRLVTNARIRAVAIVPLAVLPQRSSQKTQAP